MEELFSYSASYGFPMVVAGFLLIRMESKIDKLTVSIYELAKVIAAKL
ncbi:MAG: YvrJ family protein [Sporomusaceae bacterium]|nr:YvrJ family protein [Sporomusaceae bacterium]